MEPSRQINNANDVELIRQLKAGSEVAFENFYDRFSPALFSLIYAILRDEQQSKDVLVNAFLQMRNGIATYDSNRSSLFTWAVMISRHRAIERLRGRQPTGGTSFRVSQAGDRINERLGRAEAGSSEAARATAAFSQLDDAQRMALDLAFFSGLTQQEISQRLGASLGTTTAWIREGLLGLRDRLERGTS